MLSNLSYMQLSPINQYICNSMICKFHISSRFYSNSHTDVQDGHFHILLQIDSLHNKDICEKCVSESTSISDQLSFSSVSVKNFLLRILIVLLAQDSKKSQLP